MGMFISRDYLMRNRSTSRFVLVALVVLAVPAYSQEVSVDRDPFSAPPITKVIEAADLDRVTRITTEIVETAMKSAEERAIREVERQALLLLEEKFEVLTRKIEQDMEERFIEMSMVATRMQESAAGDPDGNIDVGSREEVVEATFVACVDGRALYRSEDGSTFYVNDHAGGAGAARCDD